MIVIWTINYYCYLINWDEENMEKEIKIMVKITIMAIMMIKMMIKIKIEIMIKIKKKKQINVDFVEMKMEIVFILEEKVEMVMPNLEVMIITEFEKMNKDQGMKVGIVNMKIQKKINLFDLGYQLEIRNEVNQSYSEVKNVKEKLK
ncbi:MAG: hypothetical protein EZS28_032244 [Streblomastix strix]|uniref:Uncharacterized protein n=1 Tax=Streblomastix strix TaxID=222440 RepID=A0A5J4UP29_9EUKA|nr:MAG: hypothetical protein EZS28_032244 [Streblomastix strix]